MKFRIETVKDFLKDSFISNLYTLEMGMLETMGYFVLDQNSNKIIDVLYTIYDEYYDSPSYEDLRQSFNQRLIDFFEKTGNPEAAGVVRTYGINSIWDTSKLANNNPEEFKKYLKTYQKHYGLIEVHSHHEPRSLEEAKRIEERGKTSFSREDNKHYKKFDEILFSFLPRGVSYRGLLIINPNMRDQFRKQFKKRMVSWLSEQPELQGIPFEKVRMYSFISSNFRFELITIFIALSKLYEKHDGLKYASHLRKRAMEYLDYPLSKFQISTPKEELFERISEKVEEVINEEFERWLKIFRKQYNEYLFIERIKLSYLFPKAEKVDLISID